MRVRKMRDFKNLDEFLRHDRVGTDTVRVVLTLDRECENEHGAYIGRTSIELTGGELRTLRQKVRA
jgi:hypothetical protein